MLGRRQRALLPSEVRGELERDERALAVARAVDGTLAVATDRALLVADGRSLLSRRPWYEVDHASWDDEAQVLDVDLIDGGHQRLVLADDQRSLLPEVVRERVQSSVVLTQRVEVSAGREVRVVCRRGADGLVVQVLPDTGVDLDDARVAADVLRARREVAAAAGMDSP